MNAVLATEGTYNWSIAQRAMAVALTLLLAVCLVPVVPSGAYGATTAGYDYQTVYSAGNGTYAIGISSDDSVTVVNESGKATIAVKASDFASTSNAMAYDAWLTEIGSQTKLLLQETSLIAVPYAAEGYTFFTLRTLDGGYVTESVFNNIAFVPCAEAAGGVLAIGIQAGESSNKALVFDGNGKAVQTLTFAASSNGALPRVTTANGEVRIAASNDATSVYHLVNGAFVALPSSLASSIVIGSNRYFVANAADRTDTVLNEKGETVVTLEGSGWTALRGFGAYLDQGDGTMKLYRASDGVVTALDGSLMNATALPGRFVVTTNKGGSRTYGLYDAETGKTTSLTTAEEQAYTGLAAAGTVNGAAAYLLPQSNGTYLLVNAALEPVRFGSYELVAPSLATSPVQKLSDGSLVGFTRTSAGAYEAVKSDGTLASSAQYASYAASGSGDTVMVNRNGRWQFLALKSTSAASQGTAGATKPATAKPSATKPAAAQPSTTSTAAHQKAVKGKTYTVGKLKYKVTSTKAGHRTVTVVGSTKGKRLSGRLVIHSTVKIKGQSFKVTAIGAHAFMGSRITRLVIGNYVTSIGRGAFYGCRHLRAVSIGKRLKTIGALAFAKDTHLKKMTIHSTHLKSVGKKVVKSAYRHMRIHVPAKKVHAYQKLFKSRTGFKRSTMRIY